MACLTCFLKASFLANVPWQPAIWIHFYALFRVETWSPFHPVSLVVKTHHWNNKIATGLDVLALNKALMISWKCSRSERCIRRREALSQLRTKDAKAFWRWMMSFGIDKGVEVWMSGSCNVWPLLFWKNLGRKLHCHLEPWKSNFQKRNCLAGKGSWKNSDDWSKTLTCGISTLLRSYAIWKDLCGYIFSCRCVTLLVDKLLHQLTRKVPGLIPPSWCRMWSITIWKNVHCHVATLLGS